MEVCRMRNTPIMTFINKLDRDGLSPLDILSDIEEKLQIECAPLSWPIGMGKRFRGVYNLYHRQLHLFTPGGQTRHQEGMLSSLIWPIPGWMKCWAARPGICATMWNYWRVPPTPLNWINTSKAARRRFFSAAPSTTSAYGNCWMPLWKWRRLRKGTAHHHPHGLPRRRNIFRLRL
jgi:hypothetical protein